MSLIIPNRGRVRKPAGSPPPAGISFVAGLDWGYDDAQEWEGPSRSKLDGIIAAGSVGDLVVLAWTFDAGADNAWSFDSAAITITDFANFTNFTGPGLYVGYGFIGSGDSDPYLTLGTVETSDWRGGSYCAAIFSGVDSFIAGSTDAFSSTGMPNANSLTPGGSPELYVTTAHIDDDNITFTAPSGWTLAAERGYSSSGYTSSTGIAYKITSNSSENAGTWGGGGNDANNAWTLAFSEA